jgi:hypothetical protein
VYRQSDTITVACIHAVTLAVLVVTAIVTCHLIFNLHTGYVRHTCIRIYENAIFGGVLPARLVYQLTRLPFLSRQRRRHPRLLHDHDVCQRHPNERALHWGVDFTGCCSSPAR